MTEIFSQSAFRRLLGRLLLVPLVLLLVSALALFYFGRRLQDATIWDRHSVEVLSATHQFEKLLVDLETGVRGYQLTEDPSFLEPYRQALPRLDPQIAFLEEEVADNPAQLRRLKEVRTDTTAWNAFAAEALQRVDAGRARDRDFNARGKELMDRVRRDIARVIEAEEGLLHDRAALIGTARRNAVVTGAAVLLALTIGICAWALAQMRLLSRTYETSLEEIHRQKEWFQVTLSSIGDAVIVTDRDGRVVFINGEAERLTGWSSADAKEKKLRTIFRIVNEETRAAVDDPVEKVFRENRVVGLANHTVLISKAGVEWQIEDSASPIYNRAGLIIGVVLVFQDATHRRTGQKAVEKARDEELAAARAKDDFLAALSHELRTPLNPVLLLASEGAANPALSAEVRRDFDVIAKNAQLEARLIDDLLDLTRVTRGKMSLDLQTVEVRGILRDALAIVQADLEEKALELTMTWDTEAPVHVRGDPARLQQVFWNVLKNAVKFTPASGRIHARLTVPPDAATVVVSVTDSGLGMTPAELARVFRAFSQGDHAEGGSMHRFGGLGLGLAISRRLVELHSGKIEATSAGRHQGATFTVTLPIVTGPATEAVPVAPAPAAGAALARAGVSRILLVEDHEPTRSTLARLLRLRGYDVTEAADVAAALAAAASQRFDLVVSDIGLPDRDGYDLMDELQQRYGLRGIALTGYGTSADVVRAEESGFVAHLTKPVSVRTLDVALASIGAKPGGGLSA